MALIRIGRISFTTNDADRLGAFYRKAFGFELMEIEHYAGEAFARLSGVEGAQARALPLRLGEETIELLAFAQRGAPYPADIGCNDPRFQHIAIVVADMETAYLRLCACEGWTAITRPAPQRLPQVRELSPRSSFAIPRGTRSNCLRSRLTTCRRAGGRRRTGPVHALGSIIPPS
jgi:catechol 2,3-dioxygenase-like lactoylglutathione lyase family enzyme